MGHIEAILSIFNTADFYANFERIISFAFAVMVGSGVKLGYKSQKQKLKWNYIIFVFCCATLVGYWIDVYATSKGWISGRGALVSAGALISESLISYFFTNDKTIWDDIKSIFIKRLGGKENDLDSND